MVAFWCSSAPTAHASDPKTPPGSSWEQAINNTDIWLSVKEMSRDPGSPKNWVAPAALPAEDPYEYRTSLGCGNKASPDANDNPTNCTFGMTVCVTAANPAGVLYYSWIRRKDDRSLPWRFNGESCSLAALPAAPAPPAVPSLAQIREAFANLPFAKPTVSIQPVGGKTLVNLPTFYEVKWDGSGLEPGSISAPVQMFSWTVEFEVSARSCTFKASQVGLGPDVSIHLIDLLGTDKASRIIDNSGATVQDLLEEESDIRVTVMRFGDAGRVEEAAAIKR
jgi:hypothetical protein